MLSSQKMLYVRNARVSHFHKRHLLEGSINLNHVFDRLFIGNHSHQINDGTVIRTGIICKKALL